MNTTATEQLPTFLRRRDAHGFTGHWQSANGEDHEQDQQRGDIWLPTTEGQLELVLHCTWVQDWFVCPCKAWLRYGERVESTGPRPALNYGGAVHEALAWRYRNPHLSLNQVEEGQMALLQAWFDERPQPGDEWRNAGRAQDLIRAYNEKWPAHEFEVLAVEEEFEVLVGEVELDSRTKAGIDAGVTPEFGYCPRIPCYLAGRKDLVVAWHDGLWVVDHKTCSDWGSGESNSHLDEGRRSFQFRGYAWAERALQGQLKAGILGFDRRIALPILGTVGNYLVSRKPYASDKPRANGKASLPRNQFHMEAFPFSDSILDEWQAQFLRTARQILAGWQDGSMRDDRHDTGCGHWGRCEFYDYCEASPEERPGMLASSLFQTKEFEHEREL